MPWFCQQAIWKVCQRNPFLSSNHKHEHLEFLDAAGTLNQVLQPHQESLYKLTIIPHIECKAKKRAMFVN